MIEVAAAETVLVPAPGGCIVMRAGTGCRFLPGVNHPRVSGSIVRVIDELPWSPMALTPPAAAQVCSAVLAGRNRVLELGSGVSTVLLGLAARAAGRQSLVVSIEQDPDWARTVSSLVAQQGLGDLVQVRHAPLTDHPDPAPVPVNRWYSPEALDDLSGPFDLMLVDGPSAFRPEWRFDRWPAGPWAARVLARNGALVLDDTNRPGEAQVAASWERLLGPAWQRTDRGRTTWFERIGAPAP